MKNWLLIFSLFIGFILLALGCYIYMFSGEIMSTPISRLFGTPVKIEKAEFTKSGIIFKNVVVYNPPQSALPAAFSAMSIEVQMTKKELVDALVFGSQIGHVKKITIDKPVFGIEVFDASGEKNNWIILLNNLVKNSTASHTSHTFHIDKVVLQSIGIELINRTKSNNIEYPPTIASLEIDQIGGPEAMTMDQIINEIARMSLIQIGKNLDERQFSQSIQSLTPLPTVGEMHHKSLL